MNVRLLVAYDGAAFSGYAAQPGPRTVQGVLEEALATFVREPVKLSAAGRTDAGVHALGQVVSFRPSIDVDAERLIHFAAGYLPADVSVIDAAEADDGFDARFSALRRSYAYLFWTGDAPHPLLGRFTTWTTKAVDVDRMNEALARIVGRHDFSAFARVRSGQSPERTVLRADAERDGNVVRVRVTADAFLHQMVRSIVGSAFDVATGSRPVEFVTEALRARNRNAAGRVAPPGGLTLVDVGYDAVTWTRDVSLGWPWVAAGEHDTFLTTGARR